MNDAVRPHPQADDPIERERCPRCGAPGYVVTRVPEGAIWRCDDQCRRRRRQQAALLAGDPWWAFV
jgi:hypothetical protein